MQLGQRLRIVHCELLLHPDAAARATLTAAATARERRLPAAFSSGILLDPALQGLEVAVLVGRHQLVVHAAVVPERSGIWTLADMPREHSVVHDVYREAPAQVVSNVEFDHCASLVS